MTVSGATARRPSSSFCRNANIRAVSSAFERAHRRRGRSEGDNAGQILRAAARAALLPAAANERIGKMNVVMPANERADALRTADLMRRNSHQIGPERTDVAGDAPRRLHRIDMQQAAGRVH